MELNFIVDGSTLDTQNLILSSLFASDKSGLRVVVLRCIPFSSFIKLKMVVVDTPTAAAVDLMVWRRLKGTLFTLLASSTLSILFGWNITLFLFLTSAGLSPEFQDSKTLPQILPIVFRLQSNSMAASLIASYFNLLCRLFKSHLVSRYSFISSLLLSVNSLILGGITQKFKSAHLKIF